MEWLRQFEHRLAVSFWCLPPDIHERMRFVASQIPAHAKILDVGGEERIIESRVQAKNFVTINVESNQSHFGHHPHRGPKDLVYNGKDLPFKKKAFDVVICIDVLEHVPARARTALIAEMLRVTRRRLIISAPLGTPSHVKSEKVLLKWLKRQGENVEFLKEHTVRGLPTPKEIEAWRKKWNGQLWYAGNSQVAHFWLKVQLSEVRIKFVRHLWFFAKTLAYAAINFIFFPFSVGQLDYTEKTNRFYLVIDV